MGLFVISFEFLDFWDGGETKTCYYYYGTYYFKEFETYLDYFVCFELSDIVPSY